MEVTTAYSCVLKLLLERTTELFPRARRLLLQITHGADLFNRLLFHKALKTALLHLYPICFFLRLISLTSRG